ncbi:hypothetical protein Aros01_08048 [Streptosporangium roseum]
MIAALRERVALDELNLSPEPGTDVERWAGTLDFAYRQLSAGLSGAEDGRNDWVRLAKDDDGEDHLVLTGLDRLDEPASLTALRADIDARMSIVDLPEALLEVHSWTNCLDRFTHVSGDVPSRKQDMITSIAAVLVSQAMNVGMRPMANPPSPWTGCIG